MANNELLEKLLSGYGPSQQLRGLDKLRQDQQNEISKIGKEQIREASQTVPLEQLQQQLDDMDGQNIKPPTQTGGQEAQGGQGGQSSQPQQSQSDVIQQLLSSIPTVKASNPFDPGGQIVTQPDGSKAISTPGFMAMMAGQGSSSVDTLKTLQDLMGSGETKQIYGVNNKTGELEELGNVPKGADVRKYKWCCRFSGPHIGSGYPRVCFS